MVTIFCLSIPLHNLDRSWFTGVADRVPAANIVLVPFKTKFNYVKFEGLGPRRRLS